MMVKRVAAVAALLLLLLGLMGIACAEDAEVLPKGRFGIGLNSYYYFPIDERYNPDGDTEDVATDFNTNLNSRVFPALQLVEAFFKMPPSSATIGRSVVSFDYHFTKAELTAAYGITDQLSIGVMVPYWWMRNKVDAGINTATATVGKNAALNTIAPLVVPGTVRLTSEDVQNLLGKGLDINGDGKIDIPGFGYKRIQTWSHDTVGDIEAGLKYQFFKNPDWRVAATAGFRFASGEIDDPDNLVDYGISNGASAVLLRMHGDYTGVKDLVLNATVRYDIQLSDTETLRVLTDPNRPITPFAEEVDRNLGDIFEVEVGGRYSFLKGFNVSLLYKFGYKPEDSLKSQSGVSFKALEAETNYHEHVGIIGLSYSTIPLFLEKKFPVPLNASLSYRNRFGGSGNLFKSDYINFGIQVFF